MLSRRDRSRSPNSWGFSKHSKDNGQENNSDMSNTMNSMMMPNMFSQGNMMMGGMYNMMMPNGMMAQTMVPTTGMDMISASGMDMIPQQPMDMQAIASPSVQGGPANMDISMIGGVMVDPSMMGLYSTINTEAMIEKKEIILKHCKLIPPDPGALVPPKRARPPGCRTIFVGGLPDKIRESTVREIFEEYGRIQILRLSKKNFCHIRFDRESCVDAAMAVSGYHIKLTSKDDKDKDEDEVPHAISGRLHVDYALSRDDQNDYERRQRQALRMQQQQMQQLNAQQEALTTTRNMSYNHSPSPPRVQPFCTSAVMQISEKIKSEDQFAATLPTLITWLERGECSKKNATQFYSMLQATNSHIRRLFNEKIMAEEELAQCRERVKNNIEQVINQLEQVAKVFSAATHQRVWDHFTKAQRKNIETWQKMTLEFNALKEEFNEKFYGEDEFNGLINRSGDGNTDEVKQLKKENESLQFELDAYKNEVDVIKAEASQEMEKFKAQFIARQALQGTLDNNPPLPSPVSKPPPPPPPPEDIDAKVLVRDEVDAVCGEAKLIGVMSAFLQVHPQGASLDYVVSYVRALFPAITQATIHHVLQKHSEVFQRTTSGIGANIEHRWKFVAFAS
ncbi:unnamed protein product [Leptidea sinapis]|uniref:RRM domain-containing protein n=1 Tax=Leptidea sinapis TaxID=189913 RepID=A0A5E4Q0X8_9NEOP|nr:unnamed protein product [Leptidea sinapis]